MATIFSHHILFYHGQPIIGINASSLPHNIPEEGDFNAKLPERPTKLHSIRSSLKSFPHLPYVLEDPIEASGIFSPLQVFVKNHYNGPKVKYNWRNPSNSPNKWGMDKRRVEEWKDLECKLLMIVDGLLLYARRFCDVSFLPGFDPKWKGALPSAWPFDQTFTTESEALSVMHRALSGFHLLFALVSYSISLCGKQNDDNDHPGWAAHLQDKYRIPATVVDAIKSSKMNNFSVPLVGVVVWPNVSHDWARHIKFMVKAGCRVYIVWDQQKWGSELRRILHSYLPDRSAIDFHRTSASASAGFSSSSSISGRSSPSSFSVYSSSTSVTSIPETSTTPIHEDNEADDYEDYFLSGGVARQGTGQSMEDYFRQVARSRERRLANYAPDDLVEFIQRERLAKERDFPTDKQKIYLWLPNARTGWIKQFLVAKGNWNDVWGDTQPHHRRFYGLDNIWEVYKGWAPVPAPGVLAPVDSDEEDLDEYFNRKPRVTINPPPTTIQQSVVNTPSHSTIPAPTVADNNMSPLSTSGSQLMDVVEESHGMDTPSPPTPTRSDSNISPPSTSGSQLVDVIKESHGMDTASAPAPTRFVDPVFFDFISRFHEPFINRLIYRYGFVPPENETPAPLDIEKIQFAFAAEKEPLDERYHKAATDFVQGISAGSPVGNLWDLSHSNPAHLPIPLSPLSAEMPLTVVPVKHARGMMYWIKPFEDTRKSDGFDLYVDDPITAVEILRRRYPSVLRAAQHMVETGRSFRTLIPKPTDVSIGPIATPQLPHRHNDFSFSRHHFREYEQMRELFFSNHQHLRAALLAGGIIWRLALEELGIDPALWGPSEATKYAFEILSEFGDFVDDGLTVEEMDFICGVYYVYGSTNKAGTSNHDTPFTFS
jgi:hypothetical protein